MFIVVRDLVESGSQILEKVNPGKTAVLEHILEQDMSLVCLNIAANSQLYLNSL